jgi:putative flippase GtrA
MDREGFIQLIKLKVKFAGSSAIATAVDFVLYNILVGQFFAPVTSNVISASVGMLINFILQKNYVFDVNRKISGAFLISLSTSIVGIGISTLIIYLLNMIPFFQDYQFITKAVATGILFFYNFYMKRFAFEKRFL